MDNIGVVVTSHNQQFLTPRTVSTLQSNRASLTFYIIDDGSEPLLDIQGFPVNRHDTPIGVQRSRNEGYRALCGSAPYMLFCDGDIVWNRGALDRMLEVLSEADDDVAYCYGNYLRAGALCEVHHAGPFDPEGLRRENRISTMSLIKTDCLPDPPFIEDEERLQDWSLWLRLLNAGLKGIWVNETLFTAHYDFDSISSRGNAHFEHWRQKISERYN